MLEFLLASSGLTLIITMSFLFKPIRKWFHIRAKDRIDIMMNTYPAPIVWIYLNKLICCSQCTGFWVGAFMSLYFQGIYIEKIQHFNGVVDTLFSMFFYGAASSGFSYLLAMIIKYLECRISEMEKQ